MAPMPPLSGLSAADNAGSHRGSPPASAAASRAPPTASTSGSSLLLRGVLTASSAGRYFVWNPSNASVSFVFPAVFSEQSTTALNTVKRALVPGTPVCLLTQVLVFLCAL